MTKRMLGLSLLTVLLVAPLQAQDPEQDNNQNTTAVQNASDTILQDNRNNSSFRYNVSNRVMSPSYEFFSFEPMSAESKAKFVEDLNVLDYLVRKSLPGSKTRAALGVQVNLYNSKPSVKVIDGFGVIMNYDVGLALAPDQQETENAANNAKDDKSDWEKAKSELQSEGTVYLDRNGNQVATARAGFARNRAVPAYDEELVTELTSGLKEALSNAVNVGQLGKDDQIMVTLRGATWSDRAGWKQSILSLRVSMSDINSSNEIELDSIETNSTIVEIDSARSGVYHNALSR